MNTFAKFNELLSAIKIDFKNKPLKNEIDEEGSTDTIIGESNNTIMLKKRVVKLDMERWSILVMET
ncbi:445_t:CDS:2 [Entrophospora sp. SA101]|nr:445_t:CDS:2 [Entrophospora sp. SA101]